MKNLYKIRTTTISVEKLISATPNEVYSAWLDRNCPGSPWSGVTRAILDPRVDGLFYRMHFSDDGEYELAHYGRFTALDSHKRIQHTWVSQHTRGLESVVTVTFDKRSDRTLVTITHENLPDDEKGRMHKSGWEYYLKTMQETLSQETQHEAG